MERQRNIWRTSLTGSPCPSTPSHLLIRSGLG
jgi:hypothetical protein